MLYIAYFQSQKEIKLLSSLTVYNKLLSIAGVIALAYFWGIKGYYIAYNLSFILILIVVINSIRKTVRFSLKLDFRRKLREHWEYARANLMAGIISETSALIDIILLSFLFDDMLEIGYYSFALTLTVALRIIPSTIQQITIPYFSSLNQKKALFLEVFNKYNKILYMIIFSTLILFVIFTPPLIHYVFGSKYDNSLHYMIILSIGWSIRNLNHLQSGAIFGLGKIKYNAYTVAFVLAGNLIIYPIAIYSFGIIGAAYASIPSGITMWIFSTYYMKKAVNNTAWKV